MYDYVKVINGITKYVDVEIVEKINGWQKWVVGSGLGIALSNSTNIFNKLKENEIIKMLDIIDKEDKIDVDKIYKEMKKQAQKSAITFDVPMLGTLTLNEKDVDKIYEFIREDKSA
jgi:uncharacterized protein YfbU (UPF0304 family)